MIGDKHEVSALQIVSELLHGSFDIQGFTLNCSVTLLRWRQLAADINYWVFFTLKLFTLKLLREHGQQMRQCAPGKGGGNQDSAAVGSWRAPSFRDWNASAAFRVHLTHSCSSFLVRYEGVASREVKLGMKCL